MQYYQPQKIAIEEPTAIGLFTNREEILESLIQMALDAKGGRTSSSVLLGRRRIGKTTVLLRVYNWLFSEQDEVVPIYINLEKCGKTITDFGEIYFSAFIRQYLAFKEKDFELARNEDLRFRDVYTLGKKYPHDRGLQAVLDTFLTAWEIEKKHALHRAAILAPKTVVSINESLMLVMVDEFQYINNFTHREDVPTPVPLTGYYQTVVESFKCPHLLSGSAVRMMMYEVINGPLAGRFDFEFLEPLSSEDSKELISKLSITEDIEIGRAEKDLIAKRTGGHPYYIDCIVRRAKKLGIYTISRENLSDILAFEITNVKGKINEFFREQLALYFKGEDLNVIKLIFLYATKFEEKQVNQEAIAKATGYSKEFVYETLCKLADADLVEQRGMSFRTLKDEILREYIQATYESEIEGLDYNRVQENTRRRIGF